MKIKNRQDFLVMLTLGVIALWVVVTFILSPLQNVWSDRQKQIHTLRDEVKEGNQLLRREAVVRGKWSDMQANALPPLMSQAEQQFLIAMDGWSRDSQAQITSIMPQWKVEGTNYMTLNCRVETGGDLSALTQFIYDIEKGPTAVKIDSIELSAHDNTGQQLTLGVEIDGLALLQK